MTDTPSASPTKDQLHWFQHRRPGCEVSSVIATIGKLDGDPALYCPTCTVFAVIPHRLLTDAPAKPTPERAPRGRF